MPEVLYISIAKLRRWPTRRPASERGSLALNLPFVNASLSARPEGGVPTTADLMKQVHRVCREVTQSRGFVRTIKDDYVAAGTWFTFQTRMRWGRLGNNVRLGRGERHDNAVFFAGSSPIEDPKVDLMLGGWSGHLTDEIGLHDSSGRIGSGVEDFLAAWESVQADERDGEFRTPAEFLRLSRERGRSWGEAMDDSFRTAYGTFDHALLNAPKQQLAGFAQVLATLPADENYDRPLIIGSPLFVEVAD